MRFHHCPKCRQRQAYIRPAPDGRVIVGCRSAACVRAVVPSIPGEAAARTVRRGLAEWTRRLMASVGDAGALADVESYRADLAATYGPKGNGFPTAECDIADLMRVALDVE